MHIFDSTYEYQIYKLALIKQCIIPWVSLVKPNQNTQNKSFLIWDENAKICIYSLLISQTDLNFCAAVFKYK